MDELDKKISSILKEDIELSNKYHKTIQNALYKNKKIKNKNRIIKFILALSSSAILTTGVVFATGITKYINEFFNSNKGIDTAIENGYILENNTEYIKSNNTGIKVTNVLMDDYNLNLIFSINFEDREELKNISDIGDFQDMIITDESNNILYCENNEMFEKYCKENKLNYKWKETNENYINSGYNAYIKEKNNKNLEYVYNFVSDKFPKSRKLKIHIGKLRVSSDKNYIIDGDWNIDVDLPEEFYKRTAYVYQVENCTRTDFDIQQVLVYDTGTKIVLKTYEEPSYKSGLTSNFTYEEFEEYMEKTKKFKNEYVENEKGQRFYPSNSTSEDSGYSNTEMKYLNYWQTFTLTKYDATDKIKIYINYKGEDVYIYLKRK